MTRERQYDHCIDQCDLRELDKFSAKTRGEMGFVLRIASTHGAHCGQAGMAEMGRSDAVHFGLGVSHRCARNINLTLDSSNQVMVNKS